MDIAMNKKDAEDIIKIIQLINKIGLNKYDKEWRKIHKENKISASHKMKIEVSRCTTDLIQPIDKRRKAFYKICNGIVVYKDYRFYFSYNTIDKTYSISSYYTSSRREEEILIINEED